MACLCRVFFFFLRNPGNGAINFPVLTFLGDKDRDRVQICYDCA